MKTLRLGSAAERGRFPRRRPPGGRLEITFDIGTNDVVTRLAIEGSTDRVTRSPAHGAHLPFEDDSFAKVVCSHGLQLLSDRGGALEEMRRVLARDGEIEVAVPGAIERNPPFAELATSLERRSGPRSAAAVRWFFSMSEPDDLRGVLAAAGFHDIRINIVRTTARGSCAPLPGVDPDETPITTETIVGRARRI